MQGGILILLLITAAYCLCAPASLPVQAGFTCSHC